MKCAPCDSKNTHGDNEHHSKIDDEVARLIACGLVGIEFTHIHLFSLIWWNQNRMEHVFLIEIFKGNCWDQVKRSYLYDLINEERWELRES